MGVGPGGGAVRRKPPRRLRRRRRLPGAARLLVLRSDQVADERYETDLAGALEPFRGDDPLNLRQAIAHVAVDQHIIIFGPMADLAARALHPVGDDLLRLSTART